MKILFSLLLMLAGIFSFAQTPTVTAIKAGKLIDTENGKVLSNQVILIQGDTITAIGPDMLAIPANAKIIDSFQSHGVAGFD